MIVQNAEDRYNCYGVYVIYVRDVPVYVGYGKYLDGRIAQHYLYINKPDIADREEEVKGHRDMYRCLYPIRNEVVFEIAGTYETKEETIKAEDDLIEKYDPAFNVRRMKNGKRVKEQHFNIKTTQELLDWVDERKPVLKRPRFEIVDYTGKVVGTFEYTESPTVLAVRKIENSKNGIGTTL